MIWSPTMDFGVGAENGCDSSVPFCVDELGHF